VCPSIIIETINKWIYEQYGFCLQVDICAVDGALGFLVDMLSYDAPSKSHAIVENAGGILRNISSHIAVREDYRYVSVKRQDLDGQLGRTYGLK
jgi:hypothetical protein